MLLCLQINVPDLLRLANVQARLLSGGAASRLSWGPLCIKRIVYRSIKVPVASMLLVLHCSPLVIRRSKCNASPTFDAVNLLLMHSNQSHRQLSDRVDFDVIKRRQQLYQPLPSAIIGPSCVTAWSHGP